MPAAPLGPLAAAVDHGAAPSRPHAATVGLGADESPTRADALESEVWSVSMSAAAVARKGALARRRAVVCVRSEVPAPTRAGAFVICVATFPTCAAGFTKLVAPCSIHGDARSPGAAPPSRGSGAFKMNGASSSTPAAPFGTGSARTSRSDRVFAMRAARVSTAARAGLARAGAARKNECGLVLETDRQRAGRATFPSRSARKDFAEELLDFLRGRT